MVQTKEERAEYMKKYNQEHKEERAIYDKKYNQEHKEESSEQSKKYYQENKEKIKEQRKTPARKKSATMADWKHSGLIDDNMDELYERYIICEHCEHCGKEFKNSYDRCMDHDHQTGLFRAFLCRSCNLKDVLKNK